MQAATQKAIVFTAPDGSKWAVAAEVVAHAIAEFRSDGDAAEYAEEFAFAMSEPTELIEWLRSDMNAEDLEPYAVLLRTPKPPTFSAAFDGSARVQHIAASWNLPKPAVAVPAGGVE